MEPTSIIDHAHRSGNTIVFLANTSGRDRFQLAEALAKFGHAMAARNVVTPYINLSVVDGRPIELRLTLGKWVADYQKVMIEAWGNYVGSELVFEKTRIPWWKILKKLLKIVNGDSD